MTTALAPKSDKMLALLSTGDMKGLSPDERLAYFKARCEHAGLDPLSAPFEWMTLQGKLTLYAKKTATDQLSALHKLKVTIVSDKVIADAVYVVRARAEAPDGRVKEEDGAVPIKGLDPTALANAVMKASTKAARRAVLSITGLSMLDESEMDTIPDAKPVHIQVTPNDPPWPTAPLAPGRDVPAMEPEVVPVAKKADPAVIARLDRFLKRTGMPKSEFGKFASEVLGRLVKSAADISQDELSALQAEHELRTTKPTSSDEIPF